MEVPGSSTVLDAIKTVGFPIVVALYFMWRDAKKMERIVRVLDAISDKLAVKVSE